VHQFYGYTKAEYKANTQGRYWNIKSNEIKGIWIHKELITGSKFVYSANTRTYGDNNEDGEYCRPQASMDRVNGEASNHSLCAVACFQHGVDTEEKIDIRVNTFDSSLSEQVNHGSSNGRVNDSSQHKIRQNDVLLTTINLWWEKKERVRTRTCPAERSAMVVWGRQLEIHSQTP
jgi:hypothetical protein